MARKQKQYTKLDDLKTKSDDQVNCRSNHNHALKLNHIFPWGNGNFCRVQTCVVCGTIREDYHYRDGTLFDRKYDRPDDYLLVGEGPRVTVKQAVAEQIRRAEKNSPAKVATRRGSGKLKVVGGTATTKATKKVG